MLKMPGKQEEEATCGRAARKASKAEFKADKGVWLKAEPVINIREKASVEGKDR